jgi:hypothetical protein
MSVPRIEVYQMEKLISIAIGSVLLANGLNDPKKQQSKDNLITPRVEIKIVSNGNVVPPAGGIHRWIDQTTKVGWVDGWTGTIYLKTITRRGASPEQDHNGILGTVRYAMLAQRQAICDRLEWHALSHIHETGATPTFEDSQHQDVTTLSYAFTGRILFEEKKDQIFIA